MKKIDAESLKLLSEKARASERKRTNLNLHDSLEDPVQRLLIAAEPETVFPVHRHIGKKELFCVLKGALALHIYDDAGNVTESIHLSPAERMDGVSIMEIDENVWHNYICLEKGSIAFEVKKGPYRPFAPEELAAFEGVKR